MANDFEQFTQAVQKHSDTASRLHPGDPPSKATVLGGGTDGRLLAALLLANGFPVTLFSAYGSEMNALRSAGGITLRGDGPIGTYQVDQTDSPSIRTTAELDGAVAAADLIFLTGPVHKQRTYAMVLADHLKDGQTLILAPARTFAAIETDWLLHVGGCRVERTIVELQHLPYWAEASGNVLYLSTCSVTTAGTLPTRQSNAVDALQPLFEQIEPAPSVIHSGLSDAGGAVECVALLVGGSLIHQAPDTAPEGAVALEERQTIRSLIENQHSQMLLAALLEERRTVARQYGVRNLPENDEWTARYSGTPAGSGRRTIPSLEHAVDLVHCAVIGSLVPLQSAAQLAGVATPTTDSVIALAGASLDRKLDTAGRRLNTIGVDASSADAARRHLESIARGER